MSGIVLEVPDDIVDALRLPAAEVATECRKELALALYERGVLSLGKARALARIPRWDFEQLLGRRQITRHYTEEDLQDDIRYARSSQ